jgi:glutaconate CoA-transferase subunit B
VVLLEHKKERLPERVSFMTSPGYGDGSNWRKRVGLPRGGPSAVITTKAVLRFDENGEAYLESVHPGVEIADVVSNTGWELRLADSVQQTQKPSHAELNAIREYDKRGFWTS